MLPVVWSNAVVWPINDAAADGVCFLGLGLLLPVFDAGKMTTDGLSCGGGGSPEHNYAPGKTGGCSGPVFTVQLDALIVTHCCLLTPLSHALHGRLSLQKCLGF